VDAGAPRLSCGRRRAYDAGVAFEPPSYLESLHLCVHGYQGAHREAIMRAPDVFAFFARLFQDPDLPDGSRAIVNAVLAYFVAPHDVMPEDDLGPFGLLDDLYVAAHAYQLLRRELAEDKLKLAWEKRGRAAAKSIRGRPPTSPGDHEDLDEVMNVVRQESRSAVGKLGRAALKLAGIG
jgi:uncharacterized membrane protein YkvA (DUF1232 family)